MAKHAIRIDYADGRLTVIHRTTVEVGGHAVSVAEPVELADPTAAVAALDALIAGNRPEMERRATAAAVGHVAAVQGIVRKGQKQVHLGGTLGPVGAARAKE